MNREDYAKIINYKGNIFREIGSDDKINYAVGDVISNLGNCWQDGEGQFFVENNFEYTYFFSCRYDIKGHKVDYDNEKEVEELNACENESEVIISNNQKFRVLNVSNDSDFEEMGYYEVELEPID